MFVVAARNVLRGIATTFVLLTLCGRPYVDMSKPDPVNAYRCRIAVAIGGAAWSYEKGATELLGCGLQFPGREW